MRTFFSVKYLNKAYLQLSVSVLLIMTEARLHSVSSFQPNKEEGSYAFMGGRGRTLRDWKGTHDRNYFIPITREIVWEGKSGTKMSNLNGGKYHRINNYLHKHANNYFPDATDKIGMFDHTAALKHRRFELLNLRRRMLHQQSKCSNQFSRYIPLSYLTVNSSTSTPGRVKPALVKRLPASRTWTR